MRFDLVRILEFAAISIKPDAQVLKLQIFPCPRHSSHSGNAVTDFKVAGFARIQGTLARILPAY